MHKTLVIAHRGASGYRPENTIEAFQLGVEQGCDGIEFDLVATKDQQLIIRHENELSETTNARTAPNSIILGESSSKICSENLTLSQIKELRAIERLPEQRPGSAKFDGIFTIPTFSELLNQEFIEKQILVIELKAGSHLKHLSTSIGDLAIQELLKLDSNGSNFSIVFESFDLEILLDVKKRALASNIDAKYFFLLEDAEFSHELLTIIARDFDGLSISLGMLFRNQKWVEESHLLNLPVWVYTARAEDADTSIEAYYEKIIQTGVDGIFADQPDLLRRVLEDRAG